MDMPAIGLGCSPYRRGVVVDLRAVVEQSLELGYRLLDTAEVYGTEPIIGEILRRRRHPPRDQLFIVSKVWQTNHAYDDVFAACERTLRRLGLSYLDLYLVHSPEAWRHRGALTNLRGLDFDEIRTLAHPTDSAGRLERAEVPLEETWSAMQELERHGLVRAIGVSNFGREHLAVLERAGGRGPAVNQIEHHPFHAQADLVRSCQDRGVHVMAHSPLRAPGLLGHERVRALAERRARTPAQVLLRWNLENGVTPIPGTRNPSHLADNLDIFDFRLRPEEMAALNALDRPGEGPNDAQEPLRG